MSERAGELAWDLTKEKLGLIFKGAELELFLSSFVPLSREQSLAHKGTPFQSKLLQPIVLIGPRSLFLQGRYRRLDRDLSQPVSIANERKLGNEFVNSHCLCLNSIYLLTIYLPISLSNYLLIRKREYM